VQLIRSPLVFAFVSCSCSCSGSCCGSSCHHSVHNTQRHQRLLALLCDDGRQATEVHFCGFAWWFVAVWVSLSLSLSLFHYPSFSEHLQLAFWLPVSLLSCLLSPFSFLPTLGPFVLVPLHMHIVGFPAESSLFGFNLTLPGASTWGLLYGKACTLVSAICMSMKWKRDICFYYYARIGDTSEISFVFNRALNRIQPNIY